MTTVGDSVINIPPGRFDEAAVVTGGAVVPVSEPIVEGGDMGTPGDSFKPENKPVTKPDAGKKEALRKAHIDYQKALEERRALQDTFIEKKNAMEDAKKARQEAKKAVAEAKKSCEISWITRRSCFWFKKSTSSAKTSKCCL